VRTALIVLAPASIDDLLGLTQRHEPIGIQALLLRRNHSTTDFECLGFFLGDNEGRPQWPREIGRLDAGGSDLLNDGAMWRAHLAKPMHCARKLFWISVVTGAGRTEESSSGSGMRRYGLDPHILRLVWSV
jgi:hypothetical protein